MSRPTELPPTTPWLLNLFSWYAGRYLGQRFHALRIARTGLPPAPTAEPIVVVANHASWWDPLVCLILHRHYFRQSRAYAPIHAQALKLYPFLGRLGFFGIEPGSVRGAAVFLRTARTILAQPGHMLWLTPQGQFTDVRLRPVTIAAGTGHLPRHLGRGIIVPLAIEYTFWDDSTPEALVRFGPPLAMSAPHSADEWTQRIAQALEATQDALATDAQSRAAARFVPLIGGRAGVGGIYDFWRRWSAWLRGQKFVAEHQVPPPEQA
jgi:1-acyl-sn-glycerol-3-phosphate acyltransferase